MRRGAFWQEAAGAVFHPSVPAASRRDEALYEALVDAIRGGRARERTLAAEELSRRLS
jgi:hypothetical protein